MIAPERRAESLGDAWRKARQDMQLSQEALSIELGCSGSYVSLIESGRVPDIILFIKMSKISGWSLEELTQGLWED